MTKWPIVHKSVRQWQATGNLSLLHSFLLDGTSASYPYCQQADLQRLHLYLLICLILQRRTDAQRSRERFFRDMLPIHLLAQQPLASL